MQMSCIIIHSRIGSLGHQEDGALGRSEEDPDGGKTIASELRLRRTKPSGDTFPMRTHQHGKGWSPACGNGLNVQAGTRELARLRFERAQRGRLPRLGFLTQWSRLAGFASPSSSS